MEEDLTLAAHNLNANELPIKGMTRQSELHALDSDPFADLGAQSALDLPQVCNSENRPNCESCEASIFILEMKLSPSMNYFFKKKTKHLG